MTRVLRLTLLSPDIVEAILDAHVLHSSAGADALPEWLQVAERLAWQGANDDPRVPASAGSGLVTLARIFELAQVVCGPRLSCLGGHGIADLRDPIKSRVANDKCSLYVLWLLNSLFRTSSS
jgi:hypothetical protein